MSHPDNKNFVTEMPSPDNKEASEKFQEMMDGIHEAYNDQILKLQNELQLSYACTLDVWYLRTRSRWTQVLENRLIQEHKDGKTINICDWPPDEIPPDLLIGLEQCKEGKFSQNPPDLEADSKLADEMCKEE